MLNETEIAVLRAAAAVDGYDPPISHAHHAAVYTLFERDLLWWHCSGWRITSAGRLVITLLDQLDAAQRGLKPAAD